MPAVDLPPILRSTKIVHLPPCTRPVRWPPGIVHRTQAGYLRRLASPAYKVLNQQSAELSPVRKKSTDHTGLSLIHACALAGALGMFMLIGSASAQ